MKPTGPALASRGGASDASRVGIQSWSSSSMPKPSSLGSSRGQASIERSDFVCITGSSKPSRRTYGTSFRVMLTSLSLCVKSTRCTASVTIISPRATAKLLGSCLLSPASCFNETIKLGMARPVAITVPTIATTKSMLPRRTPPTRSMAEAPPASFERTASSIDCSRAENRSRSIISFVSRRTVMTSSEPGTIHLCCANMIVTQDGPSPRTLGEKRDCRQHRQPLRDRHRVGTDASASQ